jgi:hypothetical protein
MIALSIEQLKLAISVVKIYYRTATSAAAMTVMAILNIKSERIVISLMLHAS